MVIKDAADIVMKATRDGDGIVKSTKVVQADFDNLHTDVCTITYSIKLQNEQDLPAELKEVVKINTDGFIEIDQSKYTGGTLNLKIQAITGYKVPKFKNLIINETCGKQTLSIANSKPYEFTVSK